MPRGRYPRSLGDRAAGTRAHKAAQAQIVKLLITIGAKVYVSGTTRRKGDYQGTMQSAGIPDLEVFLPKRARVANMRTCRVWKIEVKTGRATMTKAQRDYAELCLKAGIAHIVGDLDTVIAWLVAEGYLTRGQVLHEHLPAPS